MDAVEEIKQRLAIEDVVSEYLELKRAGRNLRALSPFSNEKTPSLMVSPEKQIWHDFSSGKGGNMFSFVMEMEGLDFKGALDLLARKAGVDLSQYSRGDGTHAKQKTRLLEAMELATKFYQVQFSKNETALEYILKKRQFTKQTALTFRLGYSPNNGAALNKFLSQKGFSNQELKQAGLVTMRARGVGDMFRGRLMIPLMDSVGSVIGFTARILEDEPNAPKYINTPQTPLYDKSRHVFGLHLAKDSIRKNKFTVVVEGNLDVIASHQAGVQNVVATAGTAVTEQHLKALARLSFDVRLAFDQDNAGLQATERSLPLASKAGVSLSIITIPSKDPDELIQKDPAAWEKAIQTPLYALDWLIKRYSELIDLRSAPGKREFTDIILKVVKQLEDSVEQDHYLTELAKLTNVDKSALRAKLSKQSSGFSPRKKNITVPKTDPRAADHVKLQNQLLATIFAGKDARSKLSLLSPEMLPEQPAREVLKFIKDNPDFSWSNKIPPELKEFEDYCKIIVLLHEELYQDLEPLELHYEAERLVTRLVDLYVKQQKAKLSSAMHGANETEMNSLLKAAKHLDELLNATKGEANG